MPTYPEKICLSNYILERLKQLGCKQIFGVPGDFNLEFLDYIEDDKDLHWVGNANELNAAYAADGYARIKRSLACIVTTYGVGELSALNGLAGSMAERVPVLHLVGVPGEGLQQKKAMLHHTLGDGVFSHFSRMSQPISATLGSLSSDLIVDRLGLEVDRVLRVALIQCRPVYLTFPTNLFHIAVPSSTLNNPLPHPHSSLLPPSVSSKISSSDEPMHSAGQGAETHYVAEQIQKLYEASHDPCVLVDACAERFGMEGEVQRLVEVTKMAYFMTPMAKGVLDEQNDLCGGIYIGANSLPSVRALVEKSDLVIAVGSLKSDFNSGSFSWGFDVNRTVELHSTHTEVGYAHFPSVTFRDLLPLLTKKLSDSVNRHGHKTGSPHGQAHCHSAAKERADAFHGPNEKSLQMEESEKKWEKGTIMQSYLWPRLAKWFRKGDVIVSETGTSNFGILDVPVPKDASVVTQVLWGSIGYSIGATLGCALAAREQNNRRTILLVGDGSLQLGVQELGTMMRNGLKPFIFILNNDGYEIERCIHGENREYNNIQPWSHQLLLKAFSSPRGGDQHKSYSVSTRDELDGLLKDDAGFNNADCIQLVEIMMQRGDAPRTLKMQTELTAKANGAV